MEEIGRRERKTLVTGGANGIGWETCRLLAASGCRIALADIDGEAAKARVGELGAGHIALQVDLSNRAEAAALPARAAEVLGGLDLIVNNAGVTDTSGQAIAALPEDAFLRLVNINLNAVEAICEAARDLMPSGSVIVNLASGASYRPLALRGPCSATKAGIVALTETYARQLASRGIRVSAVAPGYTRTPLVDALHREGRVDLDKVATTIPMGRLCMPEDIAAAVAFCASPEGVGLNGQTLLVDGGHSIGPATPGTGPDAGTAADGRIAAISGNTAESGADVVHISDRAELGNAGPLQAVIDFGLFHKPQSMADTLLAMRQTAISVVQNKARTPDFALLFVLGEAGSAATAAAEMLARTIALEWAPSGLRVNTVTWHSKTHSGLWPLCRFVVGGGASIMTAQSLQAGKLLAGGEG